LLRVTVSRRPVDHCGHAAHLSVRTPVLNGPRDMFGRTFNEVMLEEINFPLACIYSYEVSFSWAVE
jgi:hypothetical protein